MRPMLLESLQLLREVFGISECDGVLQELLRNSGYNVEAAVNAYFERGAPSSSSSGGGAKFASPAPRTASSASSASASSTPSASSSSASSAAARARAATATPAARAPAAATTGKRSPSQPTEAARTKRRQEEQEVIVIDEGFDFDAEVQRQSKAQKRAPVPLLFGRRLVQAYSITRGRVRGQDAVHFVLEGAHKSTGKKRRAAGASGSTGANLLFHTSGNGIRCRLSNTLCAFIVPLMQHGHISLEGHVQPDSLFGRMDVEVFQPLQLQLKVFVCSSFFELRGGLNEHDQMMARCACDLVQLVMSGEDSFVTSVGPVGSAEARAVSSSEQYEALLKGGADAGLIDEPVREEPLADNIDTEGPTLAVDDMLEPGHAAVNLPEMEQPEELVGVELRQYQRQALHWMSEREAATETKTQIASSEDGVVLPSEEELVVSHATGSVVCYPTQGVLSIPGESLEMPNQPLWIKLHAAKVESTEPFQLGEPVAFYCNRYSKTIQPDPPAPPAPCKGGILADEMGMGKTIMMLALILSQRQQLQQQQQESKKIRRPTLIVCPMSVLGQWCEEVTSRSAGGSLRVLQYYGTDRIKEPAAIQSYDVVVTTYGVLSSEASTGPCAGLTLPDIFAAALPKDHLFASNGLLGVHWHRVILDEAHNIKNQQTEAARACFMLQATHRWCVTGTPLQNSLDDLYTLVRFLRHEPWCDPNWWRKVIKEPYEKKDPVGLDMLRALLQEILLRRTKNLKDENGQPIVTLPRKTEIMVSVEFSEAERDFYNALMDRSRAQFRGYEAAGILSRSYAAIIVLLLRLRQVCDHPELVFGRNADMAEVLAASQPGAASSSSSLVTEAGEVLSTDYLRKLYRRYREQQICSPLKSPTNENGASAPPDDEHLANVIAQFEENSFALCECPICFDQPEPPCMLPCAHVMCKECLLSVIDRVGGCPVCMHPFDRSHIINLSQSAPASQPEPTAALASATPNKKRRKGKAEAPATPAQDGDKAGTGVFHSSAKLDAVLRTLHQVLKNGHKQVVIFSQWTLMLDMIEVHLKNAGFDNLRLDGSMSQQQREDTLSRFKRGTTSVLLVSLKAGGVGLNLTSASVVFLVDPWWNPAIEDQACDRVHRLGQQNDVEVYRFITKDSVEEKLLALQERKRQLAEQALSPESKAMAMKLSVEDLKMFFT